MIVIRDEEELDSFVNSIADQVLARLGDFIDNRLNESTLLSPSEAAALMGVSKPTLEKFASNNLIAKHQLPESRRIYYFKSDILKAIHNHQLTERGDCE